MAPISRSLSTSQARAAFRRKLLTWYDAHGRDLPWRTSRDPYRVWLSEIMLQQTRVAAVIEKYREFLLFFPNLKALAEAPEAAVLTAWSGLGYYRRARAMHAAAQTITHERGGNIPVTAEELQKLPGIGRYTSAAIASIAFGEKAAVVDGNVERVAERLVGYRLPQAKVWELAENLLSPERPGDFNQAMMELGATVCVPGEPKCMLCPVAKACATRGNLPGGGKKQRTTKATVFYALDCVGDTVRLAQRPKSAALMPLMWELPEIPPATGTPEILLRLKHSITTTNYDVCVVRASGGTRIGTTMGKRIGKKVAVGKLTQIPLTGLARKILHAADIL